MKSQRKRIQLNFSRRRLFYDEQIDCQRRVGAEKKETGNGRVRIAPMNEGQEINISEHFAGTSREIVARAVEIVEVLSDLFPDGSFTVKVESLDVQNCLYLDRQNIYAPNYEKLAPIADFKEHFSSDAESIANISV